MPAHDKLAAEDVIGGYELLRRVGKGGMAEVWVGKKAHASKAAKTVAIKIIAPHLAGQDRYSRMFKAEAELSAMLTHSNIVQVFDEGEESGISYLVMEFVDGINLVRLREALKFIDNASLKQQLIAHVVGQLLHALSYAHSVTNDAGQQLGIVHRDVSPQNVLISLAGDVKLTDFGVAHTVLEESSGVHVKGKLRYMAPEQLAGKSKEPTIDLYAVGAILHELLEGEKFRGEFDDDRVLHSQVLGGVVPKLSAPIPGELERVRLALLEPDEHRRVQSANDAIRLLSQFPGYRDMRMELGKICSSLTGVVGPRTGPQSSSSSNRIPSVNAPTPAPPRPPVQAPARPPVQAPAPPVMPERTVYMPNVYPGGAGGAAGASGPYPSVRSAPIAPTAYLPHGVPQPQHGAPAQVARPAAPPPHALGPRPHPSSRTQDDPTNTARPMRPPSRRGRDEPWTFPGQNITINPDPFPPAKRRSSMGLILGLGVAFSVVGAVLVATLLIPKEDAGEPDIAARSPTAATPAIGTPDPQSAPTPKPATIEPPQDDPPPPDPREELAAAIASKAAGDAPPDDASAPAQDPDTAPQDAAANPIGEDTPERDAREVSRTSEAKSRTTRTAAPRCTASGERVRLYLRLDGLRDAYAKIDGAVHRIDGRSSITLQAGGHVISVRASSSEPWRALGCKQLSAGDTWQLRVGAAGASVVPLR